LDRQAIQERFGILGESAAIRRVLERVRQVAPVDITVLIEGDSGVGKELVATAIHELSRRRHRRLVVVNCGAIPEGLIESELFGAERGAYTGSVERRTGLFEEADSGTVFLDEIGEMPATAQVRLLRVLESGQFSRVGSSNVLSTDARVIAATNKDLAAEVRAGRFREDLYYRLSAVILRIPPLRQRREDIVLLFDHYVRRFAQQYERRPPTIDASARELLTRYDWPGNVRELRNVAEQAVVLNRAEVVTAEALRPYLRGVSAGTGLALATKGDGLDGGERELIYRALLELRVDLREIKSLLKGGATITGEQRALPPHVESDQSDLPRDLGEDYELVAPGELAGGPYEAADVDYEVDAQPAQSSDFAGALRDGLPLPTMEEAERALILEGLHRFEGNRRLTAEALGISERTLYRKIKELEAAA
jgi:DNA-binding NtrC family response regulator